MLPLAGPKFKESTPLARLEARANPKGKGTVAMEQTPPPRGS